MPILDFQLSGAGLLQALIGAGILFLVLRLFGRIMALLPNGPYRSLFQRTFPITESLVWIVFTVWALGFVFADRLSQRLALFTLLAVSVVWLSWFAAKDFVAGVVLRLQAAYEVGQQIQLDDVEGRILRVGFLGMDVERSGGRVTRIPYSKITGALHSRHLPESSTRYQFQVEAPKLASLEATVSGIRESVLISPWSSPDTEPQIRRVSETEGTYTFEVVVSGIGPERAEAIERDIKSDLHV